MNIDQMDHLFSYLLPCPKNVVLIVGTQRVADLQLPARLLARASPSAWIEKGAVVLLFVRSDCPISNRYAPELQRLYQQYSPQGIDFRLVYPEPGLTPAAMGTHLREYGYTIPAVLDPGHEYVSRARALESFLA